jgi:hypothetical protein
MDLQTGRNITFGEWNSSNDNSKKETFADVASVQVELVDEKIFYYLIEYKNSARWKSTQQFTEGFSRTASLPRQYWQISNNGNMASIICGNYLLEGSVTDADKKLTISVRDFSGYAAARKNKNN